MRARIDALMSQRSSTVEHVTSLVDNINAQVAEIERVEAHLRKLKENLQASSVELEETMEQGSSQSEDIPHLEVELLICESECKDCDQLIDTWWSLLSSMLK